MPRGKTKKSGRGANGAGSIRKKTVKRNGKEYTYWEARYTTGYDPGTGKQIQKTITGKTQKEVSEKLRTATSCIDHGTYIAPSKMTVGEWLDIWCTTYLGNIKPRTVEIYNCNIRIHIKPALGAIRLEELNAHTIQKFYNDCSSKGLSPKSVKNIHGVLHRAIQQAVLIGYLRYNPTTACVLPRIQREELKPFDDNQISAFLKQIHGDKNEILLALTLFTGLRLGEVMGLQWNCVDFFRGTITINKQLQYRHSGNGEYQLQSTKNNKSRVIFPASSVMGMLKQHRSIQLQERLLAGQAWEDSGFVFTDELGHHLKTWNVYRSFKRTAKAIGRPDARFHDLRHSYAVAAIRAGDDIKTVQGNLGHATAAFTLDVYGHVTDQMKQVSAEHMDKYIQFVSNQ